MNSAWALRDIWRASWRAAGSARLTDDLRTFSRQLTDDSQFRWLGPEKGVTHMAARGRDQCGVGPVCAAAE